MDRFQRNRTIAIGVGMLALFGALATSCQQPPQSSGAKPDGAKQAVLVQNLAKSGAFEVTNEGLSISLSSQVIVQRWEGGNWQDVASDLVLAETCKWNPKPECTTLATGGKIQPVPWNGMSCSGQCFLGCRGNVFLGPGKFRFVVTTCDRKTRFYGPGFSLSGDDPMEPKKK